MSLIDRVPKDIIIHIFTFVEWEDIENIRLVCQYWRKLSREPKLKEVWDKLVQWDPYQVQSPLSIVDRRTLVQIPKQGVRWVTGKMKPALRRGDTCFDLWRTYTDLTGKHCFEFVIGDTFTYMRIGFVEETFDVQKIHDIMTVIGGEQGEKELGKSWCYHCLGPVYSNGKSTMHTSTTFKSLDKIKVEIDMDIGRAEFSYNGRKVGYADGFCGIPINMAVSMCDGPNSVTVQKLPTPTEIIKFDKNSESVGYSMPI